MKGNIFIKQRKKLVSRLLVLLDGCDDEGELGKRIRRAKWFQIMHGVSRNNPSLMVKEEVVVTGFCVSFFLLLLMVEGDKLGDLDFLAPKGVKRNFHVVDFIA